MKKQGVIRLQKPANQRRRNPNDLAIRLTGKWYSRYEKAGLLNASISVANSESTLNEFAQWYAPDMDYNAKVLLWGCDHKIFRPATSMMRKNNFNTK